MQILASSIRFPTHIALYGSNVYVADWGAGEVLSVPMTGGATTLLFSNPTGAYAYALALDSTDIYLTSNDVPVA